MNSTVGEITPVRVSDHGIAARHLDQNAQSVVDQLIDAGFDAYLVGGCVRDLLCGMVPKDFDVATNATPEEVKGLFRRSRLVGRRFPIAHVRFGRELIEVSTFRQGEHDSLETNAQGLITKDRAFGNLVDDAFRRDFTVNALYYDLRNHEIIDYVGGLEDIEARTIRFIGEPETRLAEDPVRMLRAIRIAAKLNFTIDPQILDQVDDAAERLETIPGARLFDEFLKLFLTGYAESAWLALRDTPLVHSLFPSCDPSNPVIAQAMANTDERIAKDLPVTPGFLVAVLLWDDFAARNKELNQQNKSDVAYDLAMDTLAVQQQHIAIPRRYSMFAREVWQLQSRLVERYPKNIKRVLGHKRFRAAFDFLVLRGAAQALDAPQSGEPNLAKLGRWWEDIQELDQDEQQKMIDAIPKAKSRKNKRRRGKQPVGDAQPGADAWQSPPPWQRKS
jgi:poly(A) polymerase